MEKSKAIELLKLAVPIKALTQQEYADFVEAVNMGMDALEQPTSPDTIDRKAALDALRRCQTYLYDARDPELKIKLSSAKAAINNLPTIQPEKAQLSKEGTTSDLISRQWLLDCINEGWIKFDTDKDANRFIHLVRDIAPSAQPEPTDIDAREAVYNLAEKIGIHQLFALTVELRGEPIQPEPKEGHWIDKGWNGDWAWQIDGRGNCWRVIECSECGKGVSVESNYCPHCGARMKGAEHETD